MAKFYCYLNSAYGDVGKSKNVSLKKNVLLLRNSEGSIMIRIVLTKKELAALKGK